MKRTMAALAAGVGMLALAGTANAATCSIDGTTFNLSPASANSGQCFSGNDTNTINSSFVMFGTSGWILADKNDDTSSGDQSILFTTPPVNNTKSGTWAINGGTLGSIVITLKGSNEFGAFLITALNGEWSMSKDLSHASIYYNPALIPLPPAALLFGTALAGVGFMSRRKKAANAA